MDARAQMDELLEKRRRAQAKIDEVKRQQGEAAAAARTAGERLTELERQALAGRKVNADTRRKAERALAAAKETQNEPWSERHAAAAAHGRDVDRELQQFASEHLRELVGEVERWGEEAARDLLAAAAALREAHARREQAASEIGQLVALTGARVHPSDVGPPSRATMAAAECGRLIQGGEPGPRLRAYPGERYAPPIPATA
jgi:hypothetical protein